jgi:hypothetical protein
LAPQPQPTPEPVPSHLPVFAAAGGGALATLAVVAMLIKRRRRGERSNSHLQEPLMKNVGTAPPAKRPFTAAINDKFVVHAQSLSQGEVKERFDNLRELLGIDTEFLKEIHRRPEGSIEDEFLRGEGVGQEHQQNFLRVRGGQFEDCKTIEHLLLHSDAVDAKLERHHVLALRLFTTTSHVCINRPMLEGCNHQRGRRHPFAATAYWMAQGLKKLSIVVANQAGSAEVSRQAYWRGITESALPGTVSEAGTLTHAQGCTDPAFMSTSRKQSVAYRRASGNGAWLNCPALLKFTTPNVQHCGADIAFLSVHEAAAEVLFPPMTLFRTVKKAQAREYHGTTVRVLEVEPDIEFNL